MPTLHLPAAHTDTDIALATEIASVVGSHELYVAWTHGDGASLPPKIEAVTRDERRPRQISPLAEAVVAMVQSISAAWNAIVHPPSARPELPAPRDDRRRSRPAAEEPSA
jgi:hypothetical protein